MALALMKVQSGEAERLEWAKVKLPHPQAPDCEVVHSEVSGPENHFPCKTHSHIVDTSTRMVIAHLLEEYKAKAGKF